MDSKIKGELIPESVRVALSGGSGGKMARDILREIGGIDVSEFDNIDTVITNADKEKMEAYKYLLKHKGTYWANRYTKISTLGAKRDFLMNLGITKDMVMSDVNS